MGKKDKNERSGGDRKEEEKERERKREREREREREKDANCFRMYLLGGGLSFASSKS